MVGGGILAIPTVCAGPGFYPATALAICLWAANVGTGLLLGEVAAAAVRRGDEDVSLRALSRDALGESGAQLTSAFFVVTEDDATIQKKFLMLMGAYVAAGGDARAARTATSATASPSSSRRRCSRERHRCPPTPRTRA